MIGLKLWQIAGWTMLHYFWVGLLLGAMALLLRRKLRWASEDAQYLVALVSLAVLCAAPVAIAWVVSQNIVTTEFHASTSLPVAARPEPMDAEPVGFAPARMPNVSEPNRAVKPAAPLPDNTWHYERFFTALNWTAVWLPWLWVIGAPLCFMLTTAGLLGAERLRRQSRPLENARIAEMCRQLAASLKMTRRIGVAVCDRIAAPILLGVFRPMILLPAVALTGWGAQQLEMVLLHELAHVRRYDNLVNLLQRIVESVLFFQPMVWIISGWVREEREHCCDALVVAHTCRPHAYAEMLVDLSERFSRDVG
jgi:beta-lactamase regulating signal transducer with metallopeptidase domain